MSNPVRCDKCNSIMESLMTHDGLRRIYLDHCIICGNLSDPVMEYNKKFKQKPLLPVKDDKREEGRYLSVEEAIRSQTLIFEIGFPSAFTRPRRGGKKR